ncbi:SDR family oxidoreductase [Brucella pseudogrignonensis]|jgi:NAD(P)-dependent dehydrogenase (short-subunit alcohol dehydrogenase family)|uniref:SDR family oxidoreductase n=1 Tax=Brucella/Ochrobactrum group TaxID=2826938 RepID=UPI000CFC8B2D|nr:SDR family oxidoreductase [Brucella pseudogrignonensis]MQP41957.1 SDR family oxidoreductase [Ochrobactrum sp. MYb237]QWK78291.1 SDR family oxidoreductase [Ochrobactrum sp. BTU1]PQZ43013.1 short chain dehydrogenase [Brucella pseudogrignonensis]PRA36503.1 short chain dehydrogenase [Brucella pseudogrignonensis]PRA61424.1 short chain dehydrogenase [Brucella pseudogrignonensis]
MNHDKKVFTLLENPETNLLANCPVLVTGGARRIGKAIVEDLAAHGFPVAIHCNRSVAEGQALAAKIVANGGKAGVVQADLANENDVRGLLQQAEAQLGPIRLLVNNASLFEDDRIGNLDMQLWDRHFAIHLKTPVILAEELAKALPEGKDGLIVNVIDQRVWKLNPHFFSYTLSKTALWNATRTLAQALAPRIRVNAIAPGPTLPSERQDISDFELQVSHLPLQRAPDLSEFGRTIRYFWESRSVTGQMIALDGGQHLAWETPDIAGIKE